MVCVTAVVRNILVKIFRTIKSKKADVTKKDFIQGIWEHSTEISPLQHTPACRDTDNKTKSVMDVLNKIERELDDAYHIQWEKLVRLFPAPYKSRPSAASKVYADYADKEVKQSATMSKFGTRAQCTYLDSIGVTFKDLIKT